MLDNGVTYLSQAFATSHDVVSLSLAVRAGAWAERESESGYAHFVEHLALRHTQNFTHSEQRALPKGAGNGWGADTNAHTAHDHTVYHLMVPTSDVAAIDGAVRLLRDWASEVVFEPRDVDREREIILSEHRTTASPVTRMYHAAHAALLEGSPYTHRTTLGSLQSVAVATPQALRAFYRRWYHPDNLAVVALGSFDESRMRERIRATFSSMRRPADPARLPELEPPVRPGPDFHVALLEEGDFPTAVKLVLKRACPPGSSALDERRRLLDELLGRSLRARLELVSSEPDSPLASATAGLEGNLPRRLSGLQMSALARRDRVREAAQVLLRELRRLELHPPSGLELSRLVSALREELLAQTSARPVSEFRRELVQGFVDGEPILEGRARRRLAVKLLSDLSERDVERHVGRWLSQSERHLLVFGSASSALPERQQLVELAGGYPLEAPSAHVPPPELRELLERIPQPGRVRLAERFGSIDTRAWRFENGATVVFKRDPSDSVLRLRAFSPGGLARQGSHRSETARLAAEGVSAAGLANHAAVDVARLLERQGVRLSPWVGSYEEGFSGSAPSEHVETLLQALHLMVQSPGADERGFERFRRSQREWRLHARSAPDAVFRDEILASVWDGHPLRAPLPLQAVEALDFQQVRRFFRERFGDMGDFTFVFVGNADPERFESLIKTYVGSLPGTARRERTTAPVIRRREGVTRVRVHQGAADKATVHLELFGDVPLQASQRALLPLLEEILRLRMAEELREKRGGTYGVQAWVEEHLPPERGQTLGIRFDCDPGRVEELRAAALQVIAELRTEGLSQAEVAGLERLRAESERARLRDPEFWLEELVNAYRRGEDPDGLLRSLRPLAGGSELQRLAKQLLRLDWYADAVLSGLPLASLSPTR